MSPDDFSAFYQAVHGHAPFPWQARLARCVAKDGWPAVLALPTAAGKTSAIDIAVFTLALEAGKPLRQRSTPLRTFFVIDRRLVVDQAACRARQLRQALESPGDRVLVYQVAQALRQFGGQHPLHVTALRGGMYRDETWARAPNQPTVCISTVDQVGSRLLFRGYGISPHAQPVHAALLGNDALYLIDEAHLSQPFLETLQAVGRYRSSPWAKEVIGGPYRIVEVSATPRSEGERFGLTGDDHDNAELSRRLNTPKPARLVAPARFEAEVVEQARKAMTGDVKVVGIVVNRVASAREIFGLLPGKPFEDKVLLTGRIRPWDREALLGRCLERMRAGRRRSVEDRPLFVVATMTVEVGADLDFDFLLTEAAPLPALRQRFGRLDRLGRFGKSSGLILLRKSKGTDSIYGDDLKKCWEWLQEQATKHEGIIDFGINTLEGLIRAAAQPPPEPEPRCAPILFPAHLDAWVQTSPAPEPSPDVAPFLHGAEALEAADVQVVWRADLTAGHEEAWPEIVAAAAPRSREAMALPAEAVKSWLREGGIVEVADVEGVRSQPSSPGSGRPALRWEGPDSEETRVIGPEQVRPGDTLVVPSDYGGADVFGWSPEARDPVPDVGDQCFNDMANAAPGGGRRLIRLRLYQGLKQGPPVAPTENGEEQQLASLAQLVQGVITSLEEQGSADSELDALLSALRGRSFGSPLMDAAVNQLVPANTRAAPYPAGLVLSARVAPRFCESFAADPEQEDDSTDVDDTSSLRSGIQAAAPVDLAEHLGGVAHWARDFATRLGVENGLVTVLERAAQLHDIGKADWRFQFLLYGGEPGEALLAKSGHDWGAAQQAQVRKRAGLPRGFRHELVSVALMRNHAAEVLADVSEQDRELALYLVGTHHGRGRPFMPVIADRQPEQVSLQWGGHLLSTSSDHRLWRLDSGWCDRFWALVRRYGYWGLAYLEALLRLADASCSAQEQEGRTS